MSPNIFMYTRHAQQALPPKPYSSHSRLDQTRIASHDDEWRADCSALFEATGVLSHAVGSSLQWLVVLKLT